MFFVQTFQVIQSYATLFGSTPFQHSIVTNLKATTFRVNDYFKFNINKADAFLQRCLARYDRIALQIGHGFKFNHESINVPLKGLSLLKTNQE